MDQSTSNACKYKQESIFADMCHRNTGKRTLAYTYMGLVPYEVALNKQNLLVQARAEGRTPDVLLLLQHPPVFTIGRFRGGEDIIVSQDKLAEEGIKVIYTNRGGSITYHGPGQLVGYPIMNLKEIGIGIREYIWKLEETLILLLSLLDIRGHRKENYPGGVWVDGEKICSIGVNISRYITMHGFALNVDNDLRYFKFINPCGMKGKEMTSVSKLYRRPVSIESVFQDLLHCFAEVFELESAQGEYIWQAMSGVQVG